MVSDLTIGKGAIVLGQSGVTKDLPGGKKGAWYNEETKESLHPDLDHLPPQKPHWDYEGPNGEKARLNLDGDWEWK